MSIDYEAQDVRHQTTYRMLIWGIVLVILAVVAGITASSISAHMAELKIAHDLPASRVELQGDQPQRFEFVKDGRVVTSIVVRP